jgi:hypothetical protein
MTEWQVGDNPLLSIPETGRGISSTTQTGVAHVKRVKT